MILFAALRRPAAALSIRRSRTSRKMPGSRPKVKMELLSPADVTADPMHINVDTMDGVVTLQRPRSTPTAAKTNAAAEAKSVKGVKEVAQHDRGRAEGAKDKVAASDDQVKEHVDDRARSATPALKNSDRA